MRKIKYFESAGRVINIHAEDASYRYYGKLDDVELRLSQNKIPFLRIHHLFSFITFFPPLYSFTHTIPP